MRTDLCARKDEIPTTQSSVFQLVGSVPAFALLRRYQYGFPTEIDGYLPRSLIFQIPSAVDEARLCVLSL